jgi:multisubunit Na+/H+ antiporter MnhC subunit
MMTHRQGSMNMPTETILVVSAIVAGFAFFAAVVTIADMTWDKSRK